MTLAEDVARLTGREVTATRPAGSVTRVAFADGTEAVAKSGDVAAEAAGLRWLAAPGAVGVPAVLGADAALLVTEAVATGSPSAADAEVFGGEDLARVERACARLPEIAGPAEAPARLHGDLWTGNVLWSGDGGAAGRSRTPRDVAHVIDPAAHGGHRETDLAMLALFGCPRLETVLAAYDEAAPLADGWRERVPVHQLWPLLVHAVLFGGSYGASALRTCAWLSGP